MKTSLLTLGLLVALPFAASAADNLSYNYVEGDYAKTNTDGNDSDGWGFKGSYNFAQNFNVFGDYNKESIDHSNTDVQKWRVGVGYHYAVAPSTDLVAHVAYNKFDPDYVDGFNGYSGEVGVRNAFGQHFEVYALAGYEDYAEKHGVNPEGQFYGRLGAQVKLNQNWGIAGDIKLDKYGTKEWTIGPRFSW